MSRGEKLVRAATVAAAVWLFVGLVGDYRWVMLTGALGGVSGMIWLASRPQSGWICRSCGASGVARTHDEAAAAHREHVARGHR